MAVGFEVSVIGHGDPDPAELVAALSSAALPDDVQVEVVDTSVRVQAQRQTALGEVAGPLVAWWLAHRPDAVLDLGAAGGELRITARAGEAAIDIVSHFIEHESGTIRGPDDTTAGRRPHRRSRVTRGFTARVMGIAREDGVLSVGFAEDAAGTGRSLILQGVDPTSASVDPIDPDEAHYCLVTETAATVYGGVKAISLHDGTLRLQLTRTAARTLGIAPTLTIALELDASATADLRNGIREVFAPGTRHSAPTLRLD